MFLLAFSTFCIFTVLRQIMTFTSYQSRHFRLISRPVTQKEKTRIVLRNPAQNKWAFLKK